MHILALRILATGPLGLRRAVNASNDVRIWATKTGDESPEVSVFAVQVWYSDGTDWEDPRDRYVNPQPPPAAGAGPVV